MPGDDSKEAQGRRLKMARVRAGYKTAVAAWPAARKIGKADVSKDTYYQHENGTRGLAAHAQAYADAFGVSAAWLMWGADPPSWAADDGSGADVKIVPKFLEARYRVQAGHWFEMDVDVPPKASAMAVLPDPRFAAWPQWLEEVVGDSVNLKIPAGHYAHVVDAGEMGYAPKTGDWVVVERRSDQGARRERTIKQVEMIDGGVRLWPRSTNPRWKEPIDVTAGTRNGEDVEAEIVGLVIGAYDPNF